MRSATRMRTARRRLYVRPYTAAEVRRFVREGRAPCCNIEHGENPPMIEFDRNPAALDSLIRRGWCICGRCYQRYLRDGNTQVVMVDRRTRLPRHY